MNKGGSMKYSKEQIEEYKSKYNHAHEIIKLWGLSYPSIQYVNGEDSWVEFEKCFIEGRASHWGNKLRARYAEGKSHFSQHGRS